MAKKKALHGREVRFAIALLRYLHANVNNYSLLLAIIAWTRTVSGPGGKWIGNNPLQLKPGGYDRGLRVGVRRGKSVYASVEMAALAVARRLSKDFKQLVRKMSRMVKSPAAQQAQALDFLMLLSLSDWDQAHYGALGPGQTRYEVVVDPETGRKRLVGRGLEYDPDNLAQYFYGTQLYGNWYALYGHPVNIPAEPTKPQPQAKRVAPRPRGEFHPIIPYEFIQPYAAQSFYEARRPSAELLDS